LKIDIEAAKKAAKASKKSGGKKESNKSKLRKILIGF